MVCIRLAQIVLLGAFGVACSRTTGLPSQSSQAIKPAPVDVCVYPDDRPQICNSSFLRLAPNTQAVNGRKLSIVGFVAMRYGVPLLYSSDTDHINDIVVNSIVIRGDRDTLTALLKEHEDKYLRIEGTFVSATPGPRTPWLGEIRPPFVISEIVQLERESLDDLLISHEYSNIGANQKR